MNPTSLTYATAVSDKERAARERLSLIAGATVSLGAIAGMVVLGIAIGWTQRQISLAYSAEPSLPLLSTELVTRGRDLFATTCIACHGEDGRGRPGLGKDLTTSEYLKSNSDGMVRSIIKEGRPANHPLNTTKVVMPPKGGNPALTDEDISAIVQFVRAIQNPSQVARGVSLVAKAPLPTEADLAAAAATALAAAGGDAELAEYIASGTRLYASTCIACHGAGGAGIKGNGKALLNNTFVQGLSDDDLLAFVKKGRDPGDSKNTTGVAMPPKGGNPALSDDDLLDVISYLRTLQPAAPAAASASK